MTKTLLSVPRRTLSRLKALAGRRKTTVSRLLREAVEKTYGIDAGMASHPDWKDDPLIKWMGSIKGPPIDGGPNDTVINHDVYLYGAKPKQPRRGR